MTTIIICIAGLVLLQLLAGAVAVVIKTLAKAIYDEAANGGGSFADFVTVLKGWMK